MPKAFGGAGAKRAKTTEDDGDDDFAPLLFIPEGKADDIPLFQDRLYTHVFSTNKYKINITIISISPPESIKDVLAMKNVDLPSWIEGLSIEQLENLKSLKPTTSKLNILLKPHIKMFEQHQKLQDYPKNNNSN